MSEKPMKFAYYFEDEKENEPFGKITKQVKFNSDGTIVVMRKFERRYDTDTSICYGLQEFADTFPVLARDIFQWMRDNQHDIKDLEMTEHTDLVPLKKVCPCCSKEKPLTDFPNNPLSFDGTHKECCECRIKECRDKKLECQAPMLPKCAKCPVFGRRKQNWNAKES